VAQDGLICETGNRDQRKPLIRPAPHPALRRIEAIDWAQTHDLDAQGCAV
jgi:hypothetical protein